MTPEIKTRIDQIRRGEVPEGFVLKRKNIIPKEWEVCQIRDVAMVSSGGTPNRNHSEYWNGGIPWVTTGELESGYIAETNETISDKALEDINLRIYPAETILMAMYGQGKTRGTVAILGMEAAVNQACAAISLKTGDPRFVLFALQNAYNDIRRLSNAGNQENLNADIIKTYSLSWPSISEQHMIVEILTTQDKIIELKEKRLTEKQSQKKYLMQQLLTGKKRLSGFDGKWNKVRLYNIVRRIVRKNDVKNGNVLTISAQYGLVSQTEFFNKLIASDDKSNYFLLHRDDFAYNKSYSSGYPYGAIKRLTMYDTGIVSPLYICFQTKDEHISVDYMEQFFEAGLINREIQASAQEGARNHGLLNISTNDFFNANIVLPSIEEQKVIVKILTAADHEIELLQKDVEQEKQKKKALMQLLLTGIVRVNV